MTNSLRTALADARAAAALARSDPSADNVAAARAAVLRLDAGYNPYRHPNGKFAPGPHAASTGSARATQRVERAKAAVGKHAERLAGSEIAKRAAVTETRGLLKEARVAAALARKTPTAANKRAAQVAANKAARSAARVDKHAAAVAKHTIAHAEAKQAHAEARQALRETKIASATSAEHPVAALVATDLRRLAVSMGTERLPDGSGSDLHSYQLTPGAQKALRDHHNEVLARYGLYNKDRGLIHANTVEVGMPDSMLGALALHWQHDGKIRLRNDVAADLVEHSKISSVSGLRHAGKLAGSENKSLAGQRARYSVNAYEISTHEAVHGHGPGITRVGHYTMLEEMSTEMVARRVTADVHGMALDKVHGAYDFYINPTVARLSEISSRTAAEAKAALADASLELKRKSGRQLSPSDELYRLGASALRHLGVHDSAKHGEIYDHMTKISEEI